jgi:hypothetical protein
LKFGVWFLAFTVLIHLAVTVLPEVNPQRVLIEPAQVDTAQVANAQPAIGFHPRMLDYIPCARAFAVCPGASPTFAAGMKLSDSC